MRKLLLVAAILCLFHSCTYADEKIPEYLRLALIQRREQIKEWALTCGPGPYEGQYSIYDNTCWQGDMTCFAGLSCLAAELARDYETADARAKDVAQAQEVSGRWVRGPMFVGKDYGKGQEENPADFSRDQTRGVFAYFLAKGYISQDPIWNAVVRGQAEDWLTWIDNHEDKICLEDSRTCELTIGARNMFFNVYRHTGSLPPRRHSSLVRSFYRSKWYYRFGFLAEIRTLFVNEVFEGKWYPRHLKASTALLYRVMNMNIPSFRKRDPRAARVFGKAVRRIYRGDPENPLYRLLYEGVTVDLIQQVLSKYTSPTKPVLTERLHDWAWQRSTSERAWERSDGHDGIYLINLILARIDGRLNW